MNHAATRPVSIALGLLFLASCNGSSSGVGPLPGPPIPPTFTRMFDNQNSPGNKTYIIAPPITAPLTPVGSFSVPGTSANGMAFNSNGVLAATDGSVGSISIFNPPYSSSTTPAVTIIGPASKLADPEGVAWDTSGNVWVADDSSTPGAVWKFTPPFTASEAPAASNTQTSSPEGLAINPASSLMFIGDNSSGQVLVVPAPYTGVPIATLTDPGGDAAALAVDQLGRLFVGDASNGKIYVFLPPFATGNLPAFTLVAGGNVVNLAFDPAQNLYAQLSSGAPGDGHVVVFNGPILGSTGAPSANLGCPSGSCGVWGGLAFGP
jgi:hypothetical protein